MSFTGTWDVASSPDFDDDYLRLEGAPYIELREEDDRVTGDYQFGVSNGEIDGRVEGENRITFSFEGMDEMDEVNGRGTATLDGDRLTFTLMYHQGDDYTFECRYRP